jgi:alkylation response protein AidB-like acyl-CoA dehydrogenase
VFECLGHGLAGEPMLAALMAGGLLPPDELAPVIAGERVVGVGFWEPQSRYDWRDVETRAQPLGDGWQLEGQKSVVLHAEAADAIIVSARLESGEFALFLVPAYAIGVDLHAYATIDGQRGADMRLTKVELPAGARLGGEADAARSVAVGTLALCAEGLGIMTWLQGATLEYLRTRMQFGAPIGRNQALQHRMAELLVEIEQARSAVINAAASLSDGATAAARAIAAAKYTIGITATRVAEEAIQMHGGIGMTDELDLSHYARRAIMIDHQLGDADHHLGQYIALAAA